MMNYVEDYLAYGFVARPRLPRAARGRRVDLSRKGLWAGCASRGFLLLAIVNIRNAWDLTLTMVRRHRRVD